MVLFNCKVLIAKLASCGRYCVDSTVSVMRKALFSVQFYKHRTLFYITTSSLGFLSEVALVLNEHSKSELFLKRL